MRHTPQRVGITFLCLALSAVGLSQNLPDQLPDPFLSKPAHAAVIDRSGIFFHQRSSVDRITCQLRSLEADHGFRVFLIVEPVLIANTPQEVASLLQLTWLPEGDGLVLVYETDSHSLGVGRDMESIPDGLGSRIPLHEASAILTRARRATPNHVAPEVFMETFMANIVRQYRDYFERRNVPVAPEQSLGLAFLTIGSFALLSIGIIVAGSIRRIPSPHRASCLRFPMVERSERLGAPCGGGDVVTRHFNAGHCR